MEKKFKYIGHGIYSISDVSRLTKIDRRKIKRWVEGYTYKAKNTKEKMSPIFETDYSLIDNKLSLSFLDLIEVRFIDAFRKHGVSWRAIRIASKKAAELLKYDHPFATKKFCTDKITIMAKIAYDEGDKELIDLVKNQYEFKEILSPYLYEGIDFSEFDIATRWWPMGKNRDVVIDPSRNFGQPIVNSYNILTSVIIDSFNTVKSIKKVTEWYEIDENSVKDAVEFENYLAA